MEPIVGLLLAAGRSRRFGSNKLLHSLVDEEPMVAVSARHLAATTDRAIVLIRERQPGLREALSKLNVEIVVVANADSGMGATLAAGVGITSLAKGWVIALGDMPFIQEETFRSVAAAIRAGAPIAAPYYGGKRGHPVGFAGLWFDTLSSLTGDEGARGLLRAHGNSIVRLEVDDPGCLLDVDAPGDLEEQASVK